MSANIEQIKAMLERTGKTNLLQKQKVDLDKEQLQLESTYLQKQQPKVDLEKEIENALDNLTTKDLRGWFHYFYEIGLKVGKEE